MKPLLAKKILILASASAAFLCTGISISHHNPSDKVRYSISEDQNPGPLPKNPSPKAGMLEGMAGREQTPVPHGDGNHPRGVSLPGSGAQASLTVEAPGGDYSPEIDLSEIDKLLIAQSLPKMRGRALGLPSLNARPSFAGGGAARGSQGRASGNSPKSNDAFDGGFDDITDLPDFFPTDIDIPPFSPETNDTHLGNLSDSSTLTHTSIVTSYTTEVGNDSSEEAARVPDAGSTAVLIGFGLVFFATIRRKLDR
jgi:hypothetical protein